MVGIIQSCIFIAIQCGALKSPVSTGCARTAQPVWLALWIVPLAILILSTNLAARPVLKSRLQLPWIVNVAFCSAGVIISLLALWLIVYLKPASDQCPGSLIGWTLNYAKAAVILSILVILHHTIVVLVLVLRVIRNIEKEISTRSAASRMVFHMEINILILVRGSSCFYGDRL